MAYNDAISSLKSALDGYSAEEEKIKALYAKAKSGAEKKYAEDAAAIESERKLRRAEAAADVMRSARNTDSILAGRGLSFSGEAAQNKIGSAITLNNRLAAIDSDSAKAARELLGGYNAQMLKLEGDEAERALKLAEGKHKLMTSIAEAESKRETELAKQQAEYARAAAAAAKANGGAEAQNETGGYVPKTSAKDLAKQIVGTITDKGYLSTDREKAQAASRLNELYSRFDLSAEYRDDLLFTLRALGYTDPAPDDPQEKSDVDLTVEGAQAAYDKGYAGEYAACQIAGFKESVSVSRAKKKALDAQLDYIYSHTSNFNDFRNICTVMGIKSTVTEEYLGKQTKKSGRTAE